MRKVTDHRVYLASSAPNCSKQRGPLPSGTAAARLRARERSLRAGKRWCNGADAVNVSGNVAAGTRRDLAAAAAQAAAAADAAASEQGTGAIVDKVGAAGTGWRCCVGTRPVAGQGRRCGRWRTRSTTAAATEQSKTAIPAAVLETRSSPEVPNPTRERLSPSRRRCSQRS